MWYEKNSLCHTECRTKKDGNICKQFKRKHFTTAVVRCLKELKWAKHKNESLQKTPI